MKKIILLSTIFLLTSISNIQSQTNYLEGAVPEIDGKVVFFRQIFTTDKEQDQLFDKIQQWAHLKYPDENDIKNRILLSDRKSGSIACQGNMNLVFKSSTLSLDQAFMSYQLLIKIEGSKCDITIRNIYFDYPSSRSNKLLSAEEMIMDEVALNKSKDKLNRYYDKFRIFSVDSINSIFSSLDSYVNGQMLYSSDRGSFRMKEDKTSILKTTGEMWEGFYKITVKDISENYIDLLSNESPLLTVNNGNINTVTTQCGGIGYFLDKPVVFTFLGSTEYLIEAMDGGDSYTISFYPKVSPDVLTSGETEAHYEDKIKKIGLTRIETPSGATAFSEAKMIIECRKILAQPIPAASIEDVKLNDKGCYKMYIGEIIGIWIK